MWKVFRYIHCVLIVLFFYFFAVPPTFSFSEKDVGTLSDAKTIWTCSMHPQIRSDKPGNCPICGMKLIPLEQKESINNKQIAQDSILQISPYTQKLLEVETSPVIRKDAFIDLRLSGTLAYDQTRVYTISSQFLGQSRVEKLYLNYIGAPIEKGEHIADIFSPELMVLQKELISTYKNRANNSGQINEASMFEGAISKAKLWGLTDEQIAEIIKTGKVKESLPIYSNVSGIVTKQNVLAHQYYNAGDVLFEISNLDDLWLNLYAYEEDIPFIKYGEKVSFTMKSFPGEIFHGMVTYIDYAVDPITRAVAVRVVVDNSKGVLKPGMFVVANIHARVDKNGNALPLDMSGKWICPIHTEYISDESGDCPICGMPLLPARDLAGKLGFTVSPIKEEVNPLLIPDTAPLITGDNAIVYIELSPGKYEGREILMGPKVGDYYVVKSGLKEGEAVVTKGNFMIDSELQIEAKPSMMNKDKSSSDTSSLSMPTSNNSMPGMKM